MQSEIDEGELRKMTPREFRNLVREERWTGSSVNACRGSVQANLVIVRRDLAFEFLQFCIRNPRPCPVLEVGDPGDPYSKLVAPGADIRTDLAGYRVLENGGCIAELTNIKEYWKDDYVFFLLGCSVSFDWLLQAADIQYRFTGGYKSNIQCVPAGRFTGHMVVTCRLFSGSQNAIRAVEITSRYPRVHGGPLHMGDPKDIGITDIRDPLTPTSSSAIEPIKADEVPLFWACGVTPQNIAEEAKIPLMITHGTGRPFVTDWLTTDLT